MSWKKTWIDPNSSELSSTDVPIKSNVRHFRASERASFCKLLPTAYTQTSSIQEIEEKNYQILNRRLEHNGKECQRVVYYHQFSVEIKKTVIFGIFVKETALWMKLPPSVAVSLTVLDWTDCQKMAVSSWWKIWRQQFYQVSKNSMSLKKDKSC